MLHSSIKINHLNDRSHLKFDTRARNCKRSILKPTLDNKNNRIIIAIHFGY